MSNLKRRLPQPIIERLAPLSRFVYRKNLTHLAMHFGTDKWGGHWYTQHYQRYLAPLRTKPVKLLEMGVGGYANSADGGQSLRMWKAFFRRGKIVGLDICDKTQFAEDRIDIRVGDQTDAKLLKALSEEYGGFDIIIDDGSHLNEHVIQSFHILFPLLKTPGIYAIEDTQTAYWPGWGGGMDSPHASTEFFKKLTDGVNHVEFPIPNYKPSYFEKNIQEIAFFHNLIIIRKEKYEEKTNAPELVEKEIVQAALSGGS